MTQQEITPSELRIRGIRALTEALGPVSMARFLQQFDSGSGDYTRDRDAWQKAITVEKAIEEIKKLREKTGCGTV